MMTYTMRLLYSISFLFLIFINTLHASPNKDAYYRTYWNPKYHARLVDYCLNADKKHCGQAVANRYCRMMGYDKSNEAKIAYNMGLTNYLGGCSSCKGWTCNGFKRITCVGQTKHKPVSDYYFRSKTFVFPRLKLYRVDWCYSQGKQCGKPAAYSFCRLMGYSEAKSFKKEAHVSATRSLDDQRLCVGDHCNGFSSITCYR